MPIRPGSATLDVDPLQIARYREMGPSGRLAAALDLNAALDVIARAGIRARHGPLPPEEVERRLFALRLTADEMRRAFGSAGESAGA